MKYELKIEFDHLDELKTFLTKQPQEENVSMKIEPYRTHKRWTDIEINFVKDNYYKFTYKQIAKSLNRPKTSVAQLITKLNKKGANLHKTHRAINL